MKDFKNTDHFGPGSLHQPCASFSYRNPTHFRSNTISIYRIEIDDLRVPY